MSKAIDDALTSRSSIVAMYCYMPVRIVPCNKMWCLECINLLVGVYLLLVSRSDDACICRFRLMVLELQAAWNWALWIYFLVNSLIYKNFANHYRNTTSDPTRMPFGHNAEWWPQSVHDASSLLPTRASGGSRSVQSERRGSLHEMRSPCWLWNLHAADARLGRRTWGRLKIYLLVIHVCLSVFMI